jgi:hypothetical protein
MSVHPSPSRDEDVIRMNRNVLKKAAGYHDIYFEGSQEIKGDEWRAYVLSCDESA